MNKVDLVHASRVSPSTCVSGYAGLPDVYPALTEETSGNAHTHIHVVDRVDSLNTAQKYGSMLQAWT